MSFLDTRSSTAERKELVELLVYLSVVFASLFFVPDLIRRGWFSGDAFHLTRTVLTAGEPYGFSLAALQAFAVGGFLGLLVVLSADRKKKLHAILLLFGAFSIGYLLIEHLNFVPRIVAFSTADYLLPIGIGFVCSVLICLWPITPIQLLDRNHTIDFEFRRGAMVVATLVIISLVAMLIEATVIYPSLNEFIDAVTGDDAVAIDVRTDYLLQDSLVVGALSWTLFKFVTYNRSTVPLVLGPSGAGKTYFMLGAFFEDRQTNASMSPSRTSALAQKANKLEETVRINDEPGWILDSTDSGKTELLEYTRESGRMLPRDVTIQSLDYAGENLEGLAAAIEQDIDLTEATNDDLPDKSNIDDVRKMKDRIERSDTLLFLLDAKTLFGDSRLATDGGAVSAFDPEKKGASDQSTNNDKSTSLSNNSESKLEEIAYYEPVLAKYGDEKRVIFALTKADILDASYRNHYGIDIYNRAEIDRFAELLTEELRYEYTTKNLLNQTRTAEVYPVYFRTKLGENDKRVPERPSTSPLSPFGFSRLMEDL